MCTHQTTDAFKIHSGEIYTGKSFKTLKQVKYNLNIMEDSENSSLLKAYFNGLYCLKHLSLHEP